MGYSQICFLLVETTGFPFLVLYFVLHSILRSQLLLQYLHPLLFQGLPASLTKSAVNSNFLRIIVAALKSTSERNSNVDFLHSLNVSFATSIASNASFHLLETFWPMTSSFELGYKMQVLSVKTLSPLIINGYSEPKSFLITSNPLMKLYYLHL